MRTRVQLLLLLLLLLLFAAAMTPACQRPQSRLPRLHPPPLAAADSAAGWMSSRSPDSLLAAGAATTQAPRLTQRLGILAPFSGTYSAYGKAYLDGAQLAVETGPPNAPAVELVPADSKGEALACLSAVRRLVHRENVVVVLGDVLNLTTLVASIEANCAGVPLYSNVATEEGIGDVGPYVFHEAASPKIEAQAAAELAALRLRLFRAAILYPDTQEGRLLAASFTERLQALGGVISVSEPYAAGTTDFTLVMRRLRDSTADVLYLPVNVDDMLLIAPALGFNGIDVQLIGTRHWQSDRLLKGAGVDLEGALAPAGGVAARRADLEGFEPLYRKRYGSESNPFAAAGFWAARKVLDVLARHPDANREELRAHLEAALAASGQEEQSMSFMIVRDGELRHFEAP